MTHMSLTSHYFLHSLFNRVFLTPGVLILLGASAAVGDQADWIRIGVTTRDEVVARYGQPDLVIDSPGGETVTYQPTQRAPFPRIEVPTIQPGGQWVADHKNAGNISGH
jgi:hypothetical protein